MKKFVVMGKFALVGLVGFLVLALGSAAYSQIPPLPDFYAAPPPSGKLQFNAFGYMDVFTAWNKNTPDPPWNTTAGFFGPHEHFLPDAPQQAFDKTHAWAESRFRLRFVADTGKQIRGTIYFEGDSNRWGEVARADAAQRNQMGQWGADRAAVEVKNAFISFGVPFIPIPTQVHAGILPIAFRPGVLAYNDGAGVVVETKIDPVNLMFKWGKALENRDQSADDVDVYGIEANTRVGGLTVGGYGFTWNMNTYPVILPPAAIAPGAVNPGLQNVDFRANFWWFGAYADGKVGPFNVQSDLVLDRGKVEDRREVPGGRARDVKYRGGLVRARVDYPWEKFNFGVTGMYASGADARKTSTTGLPGTTAAAAAVPSSRVGGYAYPPFAEQGYGDAVVFYPYDFVRATPGFAHAPGPAVAGGTYGGTWFAKLSGSYKVAPDYKVTLAALYIGDTTKNANTVGNARKGLLGPRNLRDDKDIGWELDLINDLQIYNNLRFTVGGGILFAGDALDYFDPRINRNVSPDNPWNVFTKLTYVF
jgi:hypothetical protein